MVFVLSICPLLQQAKLLQPKRLQIAFNLFIGDADVAQRDLRLGMVEDILQFGNVFKLLVMPVAECFAQRVRADAIRHIDHLGRLVELAVRLDPCDRPVTLAARKQPFCAV